MIDKELLDILCCPETKEDVTLAEQSLIDSLNSQIQSGTLSNRGGAKVSDKIDAGLIREDNKYLYPIRENIPIMLIDEALPVQGMK